MENFVVSARKYRPLGFDEVVGQSHITTTLKNAIDNNHLAQALLFCGPRGVGKTTCARILARMVNNFEDSAENNNLNIYELDAASNNSVDDIRNLIDQVRYPPQEGKYKVYIIDEVHMLSNAAFNAFLKTLEEPPEYAIFILATTEKHKVIPTILSRCQIFDFNRIQVADISDHLKGIADKESITAEDQALHLIAQKADGALRDALSIFDLIVTFSSGGEVTYKNTIDNLHILDYDYYFKVTDQLHKEDLSGALLSFDEILKNGFDGHHFITGLGAHFRDLLVCKDNATIQLLEVSEDVKKRYMEQANAISVSFLLTTLNIANGFDVSYKGSKNQRLHVELALMKMAHVNSAIKLSAQPQTVFNDGVKKKVKLSKKQENNSTTSDNVVPTPLSKSRPKKPSSLPKLTDLLSGDKITDKEIKGEEPQQEQLSEKKNNTFTEEQLKQSWDSFLDQKIVKSNDFVQVTLKRNISIVNDTEIHLALANHIEIDALEKVKVELVSFLRKKLLNDYIDVIADVNESKIEKKAYTNAEKFEIMMEKQPLLKELKERLGLDPDH